MAEEQTIEPEDNVKSSQQLPPAAVVKKGNTYRNDNNKLININNNNNNNNLNVINKNNMTTELEKFLSSCNKRNGCVCLKEILKSFDAAISEEQAWALVYQTIKLYQDAYKRSDFKIQNLFGPSNVEDLFVHNDGSVHVGSNTRGGKFYSIKSFKKLIMKLGIVVYTALDYNLQADEDCVLSSELEQLITHMTAEEADDEGIERDSEDGEEEKGCNTKELDYIIELCEQRVQPSVPEEHYKAVCRALATESLELKIFLQRVVCGDTESLRLKVDAQTSKQELDKLGFSDWARFWMQVVDELRRGVRLKKRDCSRTPVEYELTPYEILMEDIRSRKYNLRKVMVNGDIPPRVKKDAHALILEFIRSRPPLKKASDRKLPPPIKRTPSPREQLMDSIRKGQVLRPTKPRLKTRLLPTAHMEDIKKKESTLQIKSPRTTQRLIKLDRSMFSDDDDLIYSDSASTSLTSNNSSKSSSKIQMPPYPTTGYRNEKSNTTTMKSIIRRTTYDLATQCESRRTSLRRHTIVGCQNNNLSETHSMPPSRPDSRQSSDITNISQSKSPRTPEKNNSLGLKSSNNSSNLTVMETFSKNSLDENDWPEKTSDRLSLTLEEIVHIRSVMTKADLEGLPVGIRIKEDVEKRKICFLCLRTRFSIFGPWGIQCKLCQRTVCSKCYSKMRIPTEHFRNVPVILLSPSLMGSPATSNASTPSHHSHIVTNSTNVSTTSILDETFPKTLMERLLRPELERKTRNTVGSAPSSPKHLRSVTSTPGSTVEIKQNINKSNIGIINTASTSSNGILGNNCNLIKNSYHNNTSNKENNGTIHLNDGQQTTAINRNITNMSKSMEGPRSLPANSPARPYSNNSTLDRKSRFSRAFTLSSSAHMVDPKDNTIRGELMAVCNDCRTLVLEIIRASRQTRSSARNRALKNLTLDLSPVYKRCYKSDNSFKSFKVQLPFR